MDHMPSTQGISSLRSRCADGTPIPSVVLSHPLESLYILKESNNKGEKFMVTSTRKRGTDTASSGTPRTQRRKAPPPSSPRKKAKKAVKPCTNQSKTTTPNIPSTSSEAGVTASSPPSQPLGPGSSADGVLPPAALLGHPSAGAPLFAGQPGAFHALAAQMAMAGGAPILPPGFNVNASFFAHQPQFGLSTNSLHAQGPAGRLPAYLYPFPIDPALLGYPTTAFHPPSFPQGPPASFLPNGAVQGADDVQMTQAPPIHNPEEEEEDEEGGDGQGGQEREEQAEGEAPPAQVRSNVQGSSEPAQMLEGEDEDDDDKMGHGEQAEGEEDIEQQGAGDGLIEGVGRGDHPVDMARKQGLKPLPPSQRLASRVFSDTSREILTRAEDLSNRTASWIYIAMHHPATTLPFVHFASRRLRKEVPEELAKVHQEVSHIMKLLSHGSRTHSLDNVREKEEALRMAAEASKQAKEASE